MTDVERVGEGLPVVVRGEETEPIEAQPLIPQREHRQWEEYREYVRGVRCVICQLAEGKGWDGEALEDLDSVPELVNVSDPHHVKTWGAGGPDAENLVPLCRGHHGEVGNKGIASFELHYNLSLKSIAEHIFKRYLAQSLSSGTGKVVFAEYQQILSRIDALRVSGLELGKLLLKWRDERLGGKHRWEIMGFESFKHWVTAPIASGGLDMPQRTGYRCIYYAEASQYSLEDAPVEPLGSTKAQTILPMLRSSASEEERRKIIHTASSLSTTDLVEWTNKQLGRPDKKRQLEDTVGQELQLFFDSLGMEVADEDRLRLSRRILGLLRDHRVMM